MNNFSLATFLMPLIALILVVIFYFLFKKQACNVTRFKHFFFLTISLAFLCNFIWEMVQMPLFLGMAFGIRSTFFCTIASVADAIMTLLLYFGFAFIYDEPFWIKNITAFRVIALMLVGGVGAIFTESWLTSLGSWAYGENMPLIPFINVGLSPVSQFILLPVIIYYLSFKLISFFERHQ